MFCFFLLLVFIRRLPAVVDVVMLTISPYFVQCKITVFDILYVCMKRRWPEKQIVLLWITWRQLSCTNGSVRGLIAYNNLIHNHNTGFIIVLYLYWLIFENVIYVGTLHIILYMFNWINWVSETVFRNYICCYMHNEKLDLLD